MGIIISSLCRSLDRNKWQRFYEMPNMRCIPKTHSSRCIFPFPSWRLFLVIHTSPEAQPTQKTEVCDNQTPAWPSCSGLGNCGLRSDSVSKKKGHSVSNRQVWLRNQVFPRECHTDKPRLPYSPSPPSRPLEFFLAQESMKNKLSGQCP